jgi:hypothetical protein
LEFKRCNCNALKPKGILGEQNEQHFIARERVFIVGVALTALHR